MSVDVEMPPTVHKRRIPFLAMGLLSLLAALWTGLQRLGWGLSAPREEFSMIHGPLMISGFLGTLIGLERAVGCGRRWAYAGPLFSGLGAIALIAGAPVVVPQLMMILSAAILLFMPLGLVMRLAALAWLAGNVLWTIEWPLYKVVFYWAAFLVLIIAGERLELARALAYSPFVRVLFGACVSALLIGLPFGLAGIGFVLLAAWLLRYDIARRTIRQAGLTRFIAACLLSGYGWLAVGGALSVYFGEIVSIQRYDAVLHSVFLGFVMSMIFGHAPIIFPAILGKPMAFRPAFYAHLVLLHLTLALRVFGDLTDWMPGREWGGLLNAIVILMFMGNSMSALHAKDRPTESH
jgi:hypothetical protein